MSQPIRNDSARVYGPSEPAPSVSSARPAIDASNSSSDSLKVAVFDATDPAFGLSAAAAAAMRASGRRRVTAEPLSAAPLVSVPAPVDDAVDAPHATKRSRLASAAATSAASHASASAAAASGDSSSSVPLEYRDILSQQSVAESTAPALADAANASGAAAAAAATTAPVSAAASRSRHGHGDSDDSEDDDDEEDAVRYSADDAQIRTAASAALPAHFGLSALHTVSKELSTLSIDDHTFTQARAAFARQQQQQIQQQQPMMPSPAPATTTVSVSVSVSVAANKADAEVAVPSILASSMTDSAPAVADAEATVALPPIAHPQLPVGMKTPARASGALLSSYYSDRDLRADFSSLHNASNNNSNSGNASTSSFAVAFAARSAALAAAPADAVAECDLSAPAREHGRAFRAWVALFADAAANPLATFALAKESADAVALAEAWGAARNNNSESLSSTAVVGANAAPLVGLMQGIAQRVVVSLARDQRVRATLLQDATAVPTLMSYLKAVARGDVTAAAHGHSPQQQQQQQQQAMYVSPMPLHSGSPHASLTAHGHGTGPAHGHGPVVPSSASRKRRLSIGLSHSQSQTQSQTLSQSHSQTLSQGASGSVAGTPVAGSRNTANETAAAGTVGALNARNVTLVPQLAAAALWNVAPAGNAAQGHAILPLSAMQALDGNLGYDITASEQRRGEAPLLACLMLDENGRGSLDQVDAMLLRERNYSVEGDYLVHTDGITPRMRAILIDWLAELAHEYLIGREAFHLAVANFDRFVDLAGRAAWYRQHCAALLAAGHAPTDLPAPPVPFCDRSFLVSVDEVPTVTRANLQLVGICCLAITAKVDEIYPPSVVDLVAATDNAFTRAQILVMESSILRTLQWSIHPPTVFAYVRLYLRALISSAAAAAPSVPAHVAARARRAAARRRRTAARAAETAEDATRLAQAAAEASAADAAARAEARAAAEGMSRAAAAGREVEFDDACFASDAADDDFDIVSSGAGPAAAALDAAVRRQNAIAADAAARARARAAAAELDAAEAARDVAEDREDAVAAVDFPQYLLSTVAPECALPSAPSTHNGNGNSNGESDSAAANATVNVRVSARAAPFLSAHRFSRLMELLDVAILDSEHVLLPASAISAAAVALVYPEARRVIPNVFDRASLAPALIYIARFAHLPFLGAGLPALPFYNLRFSDDERHTRQSHHSGALAVAEAAVSQEMSFSAALTPAMAAEWNAVWGPSIE